MDLSKCTVHKTKIRVYCTHGYWDGVYAGRLSNHPTSNQPRGIEMIKVLMKTGAVHTQSPKQCRILKPAKNSTLWWVCSNSGRPISGPFDNKQLAQDDLEAHRSKDNLCIRKYKAVKE
jgi:hypothetical protein